MQRNMFTKSCVIVSKAELKRKCLSLHCLSPGVRTPGCAGWQRGYTTVGSDPSQAHTVSIPAERECDEEKWRMSEAYRLWAHSASSEGAIMLCAIHHWTRTRAQPRDVAQGSWSGCGQPLLIKDTVCRWKELYQDDAVHSVLECAVAPQNPPGTGTGVAIPPSHHVELGAKQPSCNPHSLLPPSEIHCLSMIFPQKLYFLQLALSSCVQHVYFNLGGLVLETSFLSNHPSLAQMMAFCISVRSLCAVHTYA